MHMKRIEYYSLNMLLKIVFCKSIYTLQKKTPLYYYIIIHYVFHAIEQYCNLNTDFILYISVDVIQAYIYVIRTIPKVSIIFSIFFGEFLLAKIIKQIIS